MNLILLPPLINGDTYEITDQAVINHVRQVLKSQEGDSLKVGQLHGLKGTAQIAAISTNQMTLSQIQLNIAPPAKLNTVVLLALPRPKALRRIVLDACSLGVNHLCLINAAKVDKSYWQSPLLQKINDYVQLGLEQAADTVPMTVSLHPLFKPFVQDELPLLQQQYQFEQQWVAHPYANASIHQQQNTTGFKLLAIGAEGGWVPFELNLLAQQGVMPIQLTSRILRTETALTYALASLS